MLQNGPNNDFGQNLDISIPKGPCHTKNTTVIVIHYGLRRREKGGVRGQKGPGCFLIWKEGGGGSEQCRQGGAHGGWEGCVHGGGGGKFLLVGAEIPTKTITLLHLIFDNYFWAPQCKYYIAEIVLQLFLCAVILAGDA